jgi:molybdopterin converting factor small subunit
MPRATFWFASPFRDWIGRSTVELSWEGPLTLRQALERIAGEHPRLRANLATDDLRQEAFDGMAAVILDGDFLSLDAALPDGAGIDVLSPLSGGVGEPRQTLGRSDCPKRRRPVMLGG